MLKAMPPMRFVPNAILVCALLNQFSPLPACATDSKKSKIAAVGDATVAPAPNSGNTDKAAAEKSDGPSPAPAPSSAPITAFGTIADVVERACSAYGGKDALAALQNSCTFYGKQGGGDSTSMGYRRIRKGNRWRIDLEPQGGEESPAVSDTTLRSDKNAVSIAFDGNDSWQSSGGDVTAVSPDKVTWLTAQETRQPTMLVNYDEKGWNFTLVGKAQYNHQPVVVIEATGPDNKPTTLYLDQQNYTVAALEYKMPQASEDGNTRESNVVVEYSQYRPTCGTLWPFKQIQYVDGKVAAEFEVGTVNALTPVNDSIFFRPNAGAAYKLSRAISVPFDYSQKEILLRGKLNDRDELLFLLDTGASETIIDRRVAAEHYLMKKGQFDIAAMSGMVSAQSSQISRLELGNLILNDVQARVLDMSGQSRSMGKPIAGIIGTNVISKMLVSIDYSKCVLIFSDLDSSARPKVASVNFTQKQAPFVPVVFNGKDKQVLLMDTGAAFNHIPTSVAKKYFSSDPANLRHVTDGTGLDGRPVQLGKVVIDSVSVAGATLAKVPFTYPIKPEGDNDSANRAGGFFQDSKLGILGNPFWQNYILTIDYKFQKIYLQANPSFKTQNQISEATTAGDNALTIKRDFRTAELNYQKGLMVANQANDGKAEAQLLGRLGNLRRVMAKDLSRPEHAKAAYDYFLKAQAKAEKLNAPEILGRILADWSLLYSDNGQGLEAKQTLDKGLQLAPQDPNVNVDCAVHLYRARQFADMQRYVEKALFIDPSNWAALWYQVKLSENFNDTPRAVATLKEIIRFYPWSQVAQAKVRSLTGGPAESTAGAPQAKKPAAAPGKAPTMPVLPQ